MNMQGSIQAPVGRGPSQRGTICVRRKLPGSAPKASENSGDSTGDTMGRRGGRGMSDSRSDA